MPACELSEANDFCKDAVMAPERGEGNVCPPRRICCSVLNAKESCKSVFFFLFFLKESF